MRVPEADLDRIRDLYTRGLCLQALAASEPFGPLREWDGTAARVLAGRLAVNLGAPKLAAWLHLRAWRDDRADLEARYYYARAMLDRHGPLAAWRVLRRFGDVPEAEWSRHAYLQADWLAFYGYVAGSLRDFATAEQWFRRAEEANPDSPWTWVERSSILEQEDRYPEALAAARRALELRPWYRPGVQAVAHLLQIMDREPEALALLQEADRRMESGPVLMQLALLQAEVRDYPAVIRSMERLRRLSPLAEAELERWMAGLESDAAYETGDLPRAVELARQSGRPFFMEVAKRLEQAPEAGRRVLLPVGFVRQHQDTCAPATLTALSRFWCMPADHLEVAAEICYDGTPAHSERNWAEEHGWIAREFTLTWECGTALLDRGIPFTLTTVEPTSAHLQAVVGYDSRRGTFLIRDPYHRNVSEALAEEMLRRYASSGPRGMLMVPRERAALLEGISLPDAELYDHLHALQSALQRHEREAAQEAVRRMRALAPEHRLTIAGVRSLASYDGDPTGVLCSVEQLLEQYPEDQSLELQRLACLREFSRREDRLRRLQEVSGRPDADPVFLQQYAQELSADAREHPKAMALLRRSLAVRPLDAISMYLLANLTWDQRRTPEAMELYRFAACLGEKEEHFSRTYFIASRHLKATDEALRFLRDRFQRFGARSAHPARTLHWALTQLDRYGEAFEVLDEALRLRPADGDLLLFAAQAHGRLGRFGQARELLEAGRGKTPPTTWLRTAAELAGIRGEPAEALELWRRVVETEPLALDAHRAIARLLAETGGPGAAPAYFAETGERFPHHYGLHQAWAEWLHEEDPAAALPVLERLVEINPEDAWTRRERAWVLNELQRTEEAFQELEIACRLSPDDTSTLALRGLILAGAGRIEEARAAYREAIRLSVDNGFALSQLIALGDTVAQRREALRFIEEELVCQTILGDALLTYRTYARDTLPADEVLAQLQEALRARPDLWHAWSAVVRQLIDMDRPAEARDTARQATERFPLLPALWLDRALACRAAGDLAGERDALGQALQINPGWSTAIRQLCHSYEREGDFAQSRALLEKAVQRDPLDVQNHGWLADALWRTGDREAALERLKQALQMEPGYEWAWGMLRQWSTELGRPEEAAELARDLARRRPREARSWLMLGGVLSGPDALEERLAAYDRALELNPRCIEAANGRAELLAEAGRFDEALEACRPAGYEAPPSELRGRAAWVEAQRGDRPAAIAQMRALLEEDPNYFWGWTQLARWYEETGAAAEYLEVAQVLTRLAPQYGPSFGNLGDARQHLGDRQGAKEAFRRSIEVDPDYAYGALALFDLQVEDGELEAAGETLEILLHRVADEWSLARGVRLALLRGDRDAAEELLARLCARATADDTPLQAAVMAMLERDWAREAQRVLAPLLEEPGTPPIMGDLWVRASVSLGEWNCEERLPALRERGEIGVLATCAYLESLGSAGKPGAIERYLKAHRPELRANLQTWGYAGYALLLGGDYRAAGEWLSDWREREQAEAWMLLNLAVSLRELDREPEAAAVSQAALTRPADVSTPRHRIWLAVDAALAGEPSSPDGAEAPSGGDPEPYYRFLQGVIEALHAVREPTGPRPEAFAAARKRLGEARSLHPGFARDRLLKRAYVRAVRRIAKEAGGFWAALWSLLMQASAV